MLAHDPEDVIIAQRDPMTPVVRRPKKPRCLTDQPENSFMRIIEQSLVAVIVEVEHRLGRDMVWAFGNMVVEGHQLSPV